MTASGSVEPATSFRKADGLTFVEYLDASSPYLQLAAADGRVFETVTLTEVARNGRTLGITMRKARVGNDGLSSGSGDVEIETVGIVFASVTAVRQSLPPTPEAGRSDLPLR